jgi:hypothetical protein
MEAPSLCPEKDANNETHSVEYRGEHLEGLVVHISPWAG